MQKDRSVWCVARAAGETCQAGRPTRPQIDGKESMSHFFLRGWDWMQVPGEKNSGKVSSARAQPTIAADHSLILLAGIGTDWSFADAMRERVYHAMLSYVYMFVQIDT